jgi:hypothetical protein
MDVLGDVHAVGDPDRAVPAATSHDDAKTPPPTQGHRDSTGWNLLIKKSKLFGLLALLLSVMLACGDGIFGPRWTACSVASVALASGADAVNAATDIDLAFSPASLHDDAKTPPPTQGRVLTNWIYSTKNNSTVVGLPALLLSVTMARTFAATSTPPPTQRVSSYGDGCGSGVLVGHGSIVWPLVACNPAPPDKLTTLSIPDPPPPPDTPLLPVLTNSTLTDIDNSSPAASHDDAKTPPPTQGHRDSTNWNLLLKKSMLIDLLVLLLSVTLACTVVTMFTRLPTQHVSSFDFGMGAFVGIGSIVRLFLVCAAFGAEVTLTLTLGP